MRNESPYCKQNANIFLHKHGLTYWHKKTYHPLQYTDILTFLQQVICKTKSGEEASAISRFGAYSVMDRCLASCISRKSDTCSTVLRVTATRPLRVYCNTQWYWSRA